MHGLVPFYGMDPCELLESLQKAKATILSPLTTTQKLGLHVEAEFNLVHLPLGLMIRFSRFDQSQDYLMQLMVTPISRYARVDPLAAFHISAGYAWCWRQFEPYLHNKKAHSY